jgi:hypothetical protein
MRMNQQDRAFVVMMIVGASVFSLLLALTYKLLKLTAPVHPFLALSIVVVGTYLAVHLAFDTVSLALRFRRLARATKAGLRRRRTTVDRMDAHLKFGGYWPRSVPILANARAWAVALMLRLPMWCGRVVVVVGPCRSGKSVLLERATPGKVITQTVETLQPHPRSFDLFEIPNSAFSIDEPMMFERRSLLSGLEALRGRGFALAIQNVDHLEMSGISDELLNYHDCIFIELGPWRNR